MKEYAFDTTMNYEGFETSFHPLEWYPSIDTCLVAVKRIMEDAPSATSFVFSIVQRDHKP